MEINDFKCATKELFSNPSLTKIHSTTPVWTNSSAETLAGLPEGSYCWVYSRTSKTTTAAVWKDSKFWFLGATTCKVSGVSKFINLPKK